MTELLLVRHAEPDLDPSRKASTWPLNDSGRAAARDLADRLAGEGPDLVVTSREPKAQQTGKIIAATIGLPVREHAGLGEQGGDSVPWMEDWETFRMAVRRHFEEPSRAVLGQESADDAADRFSGVVAETLEDARYPVLVSHGRIMASYLAAVTGVDARMIWNSFTLPDAIAVDLERRTIRRSSGG